MLRRVYDWVLHWADSPYSGWALFLLSLAESSFFPVPPDVLLIALAVAKPPQALRYALICSIGSVIGGVLGYAIGYEFMQTVGNRIVALYGLNDKIDYIQALYQRYDAWAVAIAGFTPIPYKIFTIAAGMFKINFGIFIIASAVSRSARFFLVAGLIYIFGPAIQRFIDRYFDLLAITFTVLLVLGFIAVKYFF